MLATLRRLWTRQPLLLAAFVMALVLTAGFAGRALFWMRPAMHHAVDEPIEGWMTPRLAARARGLSPEEMAAALAIEPGTGRGRTLDEIARDRGEPLSALVARIEAAALAKREPGG